MLDILLIVLNDVLDAAFGKLSSPVQCAQSCVVLCCTPHLLNKLQSTSEITYEAIYMFHDIVFKIRGFYNIKLMRIVLMHNSDICLKYTCIL
jgi:hypothetical protein